LPAIHKSWFWSNKNKCHPEIEKLVRGKYKKVLKGPAKNTTFISAAW
jgi:hypothetical protein